MIHFYGEIFGGPNFETYQIWENRCSQLNSDHLFFAAQFTDHLPSGLEKISSWQKKNIQIPRKNDHELGASTPPNHPSLLAHATI